ncbi:MAG: regulatory protein RecX [Clostridia bacterium]|nr:regulatory protein RecX [Clostridia bacterium]
MTTVRFITKRDAVCLIYSSDGLRLIVPHAMFKDRPCKPGDSMDFTAYQGWLDENAGLYAYRHAVAYLAARARSEEEVNRYLLKGGFSDAAISAACVKLRQMKYVNDEAFARSWTASCLQKRYGVYRIRRGLQEKGLPEDVINAALEDVDEQSALVSAVEVAQRLVLKYKREQASKAMPKIIQSLVRRGYPFGIARSAASLVLREEHSGTDDEEGYAGNMEE